MLSSWKRSLRKEMQIKLRMMQRKERNGTFLIMAFITLRSQINCVWCLIALPNIRVPV